MDNLVSKSIRPFAKNVIDGRETNTHVRFASVLTYIRVSRAKRVLLLSLYLTLIITP